MSVRYAIKVLAVDVDEEARTSQGTNTRLPSNGQWAAMTDGESRQAFVIRRSPHISKR